MVWNLEQDQVGNGRGVLFAGTSSNRHSCPSLAQVGRDLSGKKEVTCPLLVP